MQVTQTMIDAARRGEFDFYQRGRKLPVSAFIPTPDAVIRAMLEAALRGCTAGFATGNPALGSEAKAETAEIRIVIARPPRRRR